MSTSPQRGHVVRIVVISQQGIGRASGGLERMLP
jgi:hypothetical protein